MRANPLLPFLIILAIFFTKNTFAQIGGSWPDVVTHQNLTGGQGDSIRAERNRDCYELTTDGDTGTFCTAWVDTIVPVNPPDSCIPYEIYTHWIYRCPKPNANQIKEEYYNIEKQLADASCTRTSVSWWMTYGCPRNKKEEEFLTPEREVISTIFPNPIRIGQPLTIKSANNITSVIVMDNVGRRIKIEIEKVSNYDYTMQTNNLAPGLYILQLGERNLKLLIGQ